MIDGCLSVTHNSFVRFFFAGKVNVKVRVEKKIGDSVLSFETGHWAKQAAAAVLVQYNDTVVISTAATGSPRPGIDFFPLMCDYRERTCAAGKFPGGFIKREGRPTTKETLSARLIDRPIRPMFAEGFKDEVQCQNFVLSSDKQTDGDVLAMNGSAVACFISPMPFEEPVASCRVARVDGEFVAFQLTISWKTATWISSFLRLKKRSP